MARWLLRLLPILSLALLRAGTASAQTTGTIIGVVTDASTGKPVAGALVVATSPNLQGEQTGITDDAGRYRMTFLPPGEYEVAVQLEGFKPFERSGIRLSVDKTLRANLSMVPEAVQLEEQVVRTASPAVDVASAEAGAVISREFISAVPVGRGYESIAVVVPTAKLDTYGVSFAGSQSPENGHIVDGLNVTDPVYGTRAGSNLEPPAALRSDFIQEIDVKTGSYSPEYGRATGGIVNVVLKSGSNEFHGSVFTTWEPSNLLEPAGSEIGAAGEAIAYRTKPDEGAYTVDLGFEVGGPIMKDKLWFYAGFAPVIERTTYERYHRTNVLPDPGTGLCPAGSSPGGNVHGVPGQCVEDGTGLYLQSKVEGSSTVETTGRETYQWIGKLTYLIDGNHSVTLSTWGTPGSRTQIGTETLYNAPSNRLLETNDGMSSVMAGYKGKFQDGRLVADVGAGWFNSYETPVNTTVDGVDQFEAPRVEWRVPRALIDFEDSAACSDPDPAVALARCPVYAYQTGGRGRNFTNSNDRYVGKASLAYLFDAAGSHNVKGGIDLERFNYYVTQQFTGGARYAYMGGGLFSVTGGHGKIVGYRIGPNGVPGIDLGDWAADPGISVTWPSVGKNRSQSDSLSYFLQDVWQIQAGRLGAFTLNYGLRLETQSMENLDSDSNGFEINDNWAPRLSAIWDFTGAGRGKVGASWGRFYYAMPLDMGNRSFGPAVTLRYDLDGASCGFVDGSTRPGDFDTTNLYLPSQPGLPSGCQVRPRGGANNDLRLIGGANVTPVDPDMKGQFVDQFGAEIEYEVLPKVAVGVVYQGRRQGYVIEDMSSNDGADYYIGNPGRDNDVYLPDGTFAGNSRYVTTVDPQTGREVDIEFPRPERSYDAVTFQVTKQFSQNWLAQAHYTWSSLRGNYPGPFRPEDGQLDPGITSEYDLASLMANRTGYLPADQTHQIKVYAAYVWNVSRRFNVSTSGAYNGISGVPVSVLGAHPSYGSGQAFIIPRGQGGRTPWANTFDLGGGLEYVIRAPYSVSFRVDVFNLLNSQKALEYDEDYTFDSVAPISGIDCRGEGAAGTPVPIQALLAECPDIAYLRTVEGRPVTVNPNWGRPGRSTTAFQAPLSVRFGLSLTF